MKRLLPALVLAAGCAGTGPGLVSLDEEWTLGDRLAADVLARSRLLEDPSVGAFVARLGDAILEEARADYAAASRPWRFHVLADTTVNAFALPGGQVFVTSGLLLAAGDDVEVQVLLGHQIAHALDRHALRNLARAGVLVDRLPDAAEYGAILETFPAGGPAFDGSAEDEADRVSVAYAYKAGADPFALVTISRKLKDLLVEKPESVRGYLDAHAVTEERLLDLRRRVRTLPQKPFRTPDPDFPAVRAASSP